MELKNKTINFLGDSITEGVGVSSKTVRFTELIREKYGLAAANNYGIAEQELPVRQSQAPPLPLTLISASASAKWNRMQI